MSTETPVRLSYARRGGRRRRLTAAALVVVGLTAAAFAYRGRDRWLPAVRRRWDSFQLARSQARCLAFSPPPDTVAFTDSAGAPTDGDHYRVTHDGHPSVVWQPPVWCNFLSRARATDADTETFSRTFNLVTSGASPGGWQAAPCMLHERHLANGDAVLACAVVTVGYQSTELSGFYWTVGSPPRMTAGATRRAVSGDSLYIEKSNPADAITIGVGRPDLTDPAGFDIPYRVGDRAGMIHGRCGRDRVTFAPDGGWLNADRRVWVTDGTGVRLHDRTTPDYVMAYPTEPDPPPDSRPDQLLFGDDGRQLFAVLDRRSRPRVVAWDWASRRATVLADLDNPAVRWLQHAGATLTRNAKLCISLVYGRNQPASEPSPSEVDLCGVDVATGREVGRTAPLPVDTELVGLSPNGRTAYCTAGRRLWAVDLVSWKQRAAVDLPHEVYEMAIGPTRIAVTTVSPAGEDMGMPDRTLILSADTLAPVCPPGGPLFHLRFDSSGEHLFSLAANTDYRRPLPPGLYVVDANTGAVGRSPAPFTYGRAFTADLARSAFSADGRWWAADDWSVNPRYTYLWSRPGLRDVWRIENRVLPWTGPAFSPDGHSLATATDAGVAVWSLPR